MKYTKVKFGAKKIVKLYKAGKNISLIAWAIGYPAGHRNNRIAALGEAAVYKSAR
jgi:hypothetical protein